MAKSLRAPVRLIASNAGVEGDVIIEKLLGKSFETGYNAVSPHAAAALHPFCSTVSGSSSFHIRTQMHCTPRRRRYLRRCIDVQCVCNVHDVCLMKYQAVEVADSSMCMCSAQMEDRVEDLLAAGVLDPAKVTRSGLMNACGIAGIMLTTQVGFLSTVKINERTEKLE